jgi:hypothetical protein
MFEHIRHKSALSLVLGNTVYNLATSIFRIVNWYFIILLCFVAKKLRSTSVNVNYSLVNSFFGSYSDIQNFLAENDCVEGSIYRLNNSCEHTDEDISVTLGHNIFVMKYLGN